jgi:aldos-2-ulose dehydratase/isomerase family protein/VCBS repeat protein
MKTTLLFLMLIAFPGLAAEKTPRFRAQEIDSKIEIGYGVAAADVNGDGKPDILLADKKQFVWYENPSWKKHVLAENLTEHDNVCIAARDLDGDGKCEIAVGAEWNPSDTVGSGAVFYLIPPADRAQKWEAVKLHAEPTVHRMKWVRRGNRDDGKPRFDLVVVPLHGRGNKDGAGAGVKVLAYQMPSDPHQEWKTEVVCDDMHMTHNFDVVSENNDDEPEFIVLGGKEGIVTINKEPSSWEGISLFVHRGSPELKGVGEVRHGMFPHTGKLQMMSLAAIEPMHGNQLVTYSRQNPDQIATWRRTVLDSTLDDGHALACGDLLGAGSNQIVVGWRAMAHPEAKVGIKLFVPDEKAEKWTQHLIDDNTMACEDLVLADLDGDKKLDIIASGRRTKNLKVYWNETK